MDYFTARQHMVESQVRVNDVTDPALQKAMRHIERERLVAPSQAFAAYAEVEAQIAPERALMRPRDIAKLLHTLKPEAGQKVLALAAPYAAAVLAHAGLKVTAQEGDARAASVVGPYLNELGVKTVVQDLHIPADGSYDLIITEGAVTEVPESWTEALAMGGRLAVVVRISAIGKAKLYTRVASGVSDADVFDSSPSILSGFEARPAFVF